MFLGFKHTHTFVERPRSLNLYSNMYIFKYTHTCIYIHTYKHTHIYVCSMCIGNCSGVHSSFAGIGNKWITLLLTLKFSIKQLRFFSKSIRSGPRWQGPHQIHLITILTLPTVSQFSQATLLPLSPSHDYPGSEGMISFCVANTLHMILLHQTKDSSIVKLVSYHCLLYSPLAWS